ncbi:MAG: helix-turn-helix transcriptional regulator [Acidobacteria bacterium]|nr:helix-turn-helix transcriptional regulator [Acidobacteriota bacterium]
MARKKTTAEEDLFNQSIGKHIESLRKRAGLTQRALAQSVGLKQQSLASIECGKTRCSLFMMAKIARRLGIPVAAITRNTNLGCIPAPEQKNHVSLSANHS